MNILKLLLVILFSITPKVIYASQCEVFEGYQLKTKLCWNQEHKAWMSEKCLTTPCKAKTFLEGKKVEVKLPSNIGGQNPSSLYCRALKKNVIILHDSEKYEQSFCQFADKSLVDVNATARKLK